MVSKSVTGCMLKIMHVRFYKVVIEGEIGQTYNIGGHNQKTNLEVVHAICEILDDLTPSSLPGAFNQITKPSSEGAMGSQSYKDLITFVSDRPGHDQRYAINANKIKNDLGWTPQETFETGLKKTVMWYLNNPNFYQHIQGGGYQRQRLGIAKQKPVNKL